MRSVAAEYRSRAHAAETTITIHMCFGILNPRHSPDIVVLRRAPVFEKHRIAGTGQFLDKERIRSGSGLAGAYANSNFLCYNSFTGQGQLLWVGAACSTVLDGV
jgi:hypothetical protein